ncbi:MULTISPECIES: FxsA family protein [Nocardioides]|uniref:FxsA family protein n=1 Tax=Nocardioides vastitatis TaxID=2568655 RepID=A0ABW0ZDC1_9ACTN|nr:FxsA family protein [Nocardioides sp.]THI96908.1 FxsA family protein [Nocardioides sp.]
MHALAVTLASALLRVEEQTPEDEDVLAGWMGFAVFVFLIVAVAIIGWALTKSLRTADRAKDAGVYGDAPSSEDEKTD